MYLAISRIAYLIFYNQFLLILLVALFSLILFYLSKRKVFFQILKFILVYFILISVIPTGKLLLLYLESSYPNKINLPDQIDGILVLSGHENLELSNEYDQLYLGGSTYRLIESVRLGNMYPKAKIVFSGGSGDLFGKQISSEVAKKFYDEMNLENQIIFESNSTNTYENILFSRKLLSPEFDENWILLTSAFHMKRAIGVANNLDWKFIPYSVDYKLSKNNYQKMINFNILENIHFFQIASHEFVGIIIYKILKRTS